MRVVLERAARYWALLGGGVLLLIVAITGLNALAYGLDAIARMWAAHVPGVPGYEDFVRLSIGAAAPMFLPYCHAQRGHLAVDILPKDLGGEFGRRFDASAQRLGDLGIGAAALFLSYWLGLGMIESHADGAVSRVLGWPEWPFYIPGLLSLLLWAAIALSHGLSAQPHPGASGGAHG
ncbi:MAG: TRAP transporter small permease [Neomegalonema sp.]|nr:TRAP transporter small permease [Neomegalonema sp.]